MENQKSTKAIGLTGGIGSGKSFVANLFKEKGVPVYFSDDRAKAIMVESETVKLALIDLLGQETYTDQGALNKTYVAEIIFTDKGKLTSLNGIVHPAVFEDFKKWIQRQKSRYVLKESAILFENKSNVLCDRVILVTADETIRIQRVMKRDQVSTQQVLARIKNQLSEADKIDLADYVLYNNGSFDEIVKQVGVLHRQLSKL